MPRCYNDSKTVSSVNSNHTHSIDDIVLTQSHGFSIGSHLEADEDPPVVEKSHRRLRCDLSPVPTSGNSNLNIKLFGLKVRLIRISFLCKIGLYMKAPIMYSKYIEGCKRLLNFLFLVFSRVIKVVRIIR